MTPWPDNATRCWTYKHDQAIEYQSIMEVGDETWTLAYEAGRPVWRRAAPAKSTPGAPGPEATGVDPEVERRFKLRPKGATWADKLPGLLEGLAGRQPLPANYRRAVGLPGLPPAGFG